MIRYSEFNITIGKHARQRMQQRGIPPLVAYMIIKFADGETYVGKNCTSLWVSREQAKQLCKDGQLKPKEAEKICGKSVLVSDDDEGSTMVTAMHLDGDLKGRHYRKFMKKDLRPRTRRPRTRRSRTRRSRTRH